VTASSPLLAVVISSGIRMANVRYPALAWHGGLFLAALGAVGLGWPDLSWPWYLLFPLLLYAGITIVLPRLRRTAPRLRVGRLGGAPLACAVILSSIVAGFLVGYHKIVDPNVRDLADRLPVAMFGSVICAGVCFSVVNALLEELMFRGILWEVVAGEWNAPLALGVTAVLFGVGHYHGYPPGLVGAILAGIYGVALGLLRWTTGGLGLAVACHISADATIFSLLVGERATSAGNMP
jgi:membrane protease YdiL (CAAX protease family)